MSGLHVKKLTLDWCRISGINNVSEANIGTHIRKQRIVQIDWKEKSGKTAEKTFKNTVTINNSKPHALAQISVQESDKHTKVYLKKGIIKGLDTPAKIKLPLPRDVQHLGNVLDIDLGQIVQEYPQTRPTHMTLREKHLGRGVTSATVQYKEAKVEYKFKLQLAMNVSVIILNWQCPFAGIVRSLINRKYKELNGFRIENDDIYFEVSGKVVFHKDAQHEVTWQ